MPSPFNHTCEGELKLEIAILFNGRRRVTRRFELKKNENVDDVIFAVYGAADPATITTCTTGYTNLKLVSQEVVPNEKGISILVQVFETLTATLVKEGESVLGRDINDILVAKIPYIGLPAATGGLNVGDAFVVGGVNCVVSEIEVQENDAFKRVTYVAREVGSGIGGAGEIQVGGDEVVVDPNKRHTLTRRFQQAASDAYVAGVIGTVLVVGGVSYVLAQESKTETAAIRQIVRVYVEATATWTAVGPDKTDRDMNGLLRVRMNLVAKAGTAAPTLDIGVSDYVSGGTTVYLARATDAESDEAVSRITAEYLEPGELASSTRLSNNGALETRSSSWFFSSPATPSGFVLVGTQESNVGGYPTVEYSFAKGVGQVAYSTSSSSNGALLQVSIRHLSAPGASNPILTPSGYVLVEGPSFQEADGHIVWSAGFAKGTGQVAYSTSSSANGALLRVSIQHLTAPGASNPILTPSGFVLVEGPSFQEADGHLVWSAAFAKGTGEISRATQGREDGTTISVRALSAPGATNPVSAPAGYVVTEATPTEADGHRVWSVQFAKGNDVVDYDLNGLKRRTVTTVYAAGASPTALTVGTTAHPTDTSLILARLKDVENDANVTRTAVYLKPGVLSKSSSPGEIVGTTKNTWQTWLVDPTNAAAMTAAGAGSPLAGEKTAESTENVQGYPVLSVTTLTGTIAGVKTTYKDVTDVLTPGYITPTTITTPQGTVAELRVVPPRRKTIPITVTIEITSTPPNSTPTLAYNLEDISCSATRTSYSYSGNGQRVLTNLAGTNRFKGERWSAGASGDTQTFPACYYTAATSSGVVTFTSDWYDASSSDSSIVPVAMTTTINSEIVCSGASGVGAGYLTAGLIQRKVRPVLTTLDGTVYWEVVSFTA